MNKIKCKMLNQIDYPKGYLNSLIKNIDNLYSKSRYELMIYILKAFMNK